MIKAVVIYLCEDFPDFNQGAECVKVVNRRAEALTETRLFLRKIFWIELYAYQLEETKTR